MDIALLHSLSNQEKLKIVFDLWDDIASSEEPIILDHETIAEINRRHAELLADPSIAIDDQEMWRRVND